MKLQDKYYYLPNINNINYLLNDDNIIREVCVFYCDEKYFITTKNRWTQIFDKNSYCLIDPYIDILAINKDDSYSIHLPEKYKMSNLTNITQVYNKDSNYIKLYNNSYIYKNYSECYNKLLEIVKNIIDSETSIINDRLNVIELITKKFKII